MTASELELAMVGCDGYTVMLNGYPALDITSVKIQKPSKTEGGYVILKLGKRKE